LHGPVDSDGAKLNYKYPIRSTVKSGCNVMISMNDNHGQLARHMNCNYDDDKGHSKPAVIENAGTNQSCWLVVQKQF